MKKPNKLSAIIVIVAILGSGVMVGAVIGLILAVLTGLKGLCG